METTPVTVFEGGGLDSSGRPLCDLTMNGSLLRRTVEALSRATATKDLDPVMALFATDAELVLDDGLHRLKVGDSWAIRAILYRDLLEAPLVLLTEWREPTGELVGTYSLASRPETPAGRLRLLPLLPRGERIARLAIRKTLFEGNAV